MVRIGNFEVLGPSRRSFNADVPNFGHLKDIPWRERTLICVQGGNTVNLYGLVIGFRTAKKKSNEKPGDIIVIEDIPLSQKLEIREFFQKQEILKGSVVFYTGQYTIHPTQARKK